MSLRRSIKNKRRKTETVDEDDIALDNIFSYLELAAFCPKKVFDIIFITEASESSSELLNDLIQTAKEYEEMSCLTFITLEEVLQLLDHLDPSVFPSSFQSILQEIHQRIKRKAMLNQNPLAQLIKLKLLEVMSRHFLKEISKREKIETLENELTLLAQDSKKSPKKSPKKKEIPIVVPDQKKSSVMFGRGMVERKSKGRIDAKSSHAVDVGYKLTGSSSDIVFDDDILNHVWFYVFKGFSDEDLLEQLYSINVPIRALIKFDVPISNTITSSSAYRIFWEGIQRYFDGPKRSKNFENTILMQFKASGGSTKEVLEELVYVIKNITDIKLRHLDYIRHIKIHQLEESHKLVPLECLHAYSYSSIETPLEITNEATVLMNLLEEVSMRADKIELRDLWKSISSLSISHMDNGKNACDDMFKEEYTKKSPFRKPKNTFMVHESDILRVILKTFGSSGSTFVDNLNSVLRIQRPFTLLQGTEYDAHDLIHKHDVDPSKKPERNLTKSQLHFLYLFLFSTFEHQDAIEVFEDTELTENLQTYTRALSCSSLHPLVETGESDSEKLPPNLYEPSAMAFIWKEELPSQVMAQEIWNNQLSFQYMDMKFSPETDNLLVQFSDHLDDFGVNTKTFDVSLRTPVCLRDFCKYITVDESKWLEDNKPAKYVRKSDEMEECKGANKMNKLEMFREYRHLLNPMDMPIVMDPEETQIEGEESTVTFEQNLMDIENYPSSSRLIEECERDRVKSFLAYNLGTKYFAVRGTETVFCSHDNVKIRVDNTRMIYEEPKCTVCLTCKGNSLVLHSSKTFLGRKYNFHWNLEDGTVISFTLQDQHQRAARSLVSPSENELVEEMVTETDDEDDTWLREVMNQKVINMSKADFEEELRTVDDSRTEDLQNEDVADIFECLKQAVLEGCPVYKISDNLTYLTRRHSKTKIPLTNIMRRLLHNEKKEVSPGHYTKRFISLRDNSVNVKKPLDFRICLPNGLYITCYPSLIRDNLVEVKQEFVTGEERSEEFRLFTRDGHIFVKKIDGTIILMKSNGDTVMFENPDSQDPIIRESNLKTCHRKNFDDYRKKLNKMMKNETGNDEFYISRRDILKSKKGYVINKDIMDVLDSNKVPYLKRTLLSFDGNRTTLKTNKITQKRTFYTTTEQDFLAEELFFERDDGFRCLFDKNGSQVVKFPDGTKISTSIRVSKNLVDGYVFVSLVFSYGHPDYLTVTYDSQDSLSVFMKDDVILERNVENDIILKFGDDVISEVDSGNVTFEKLCKECDSKFECSFSISPFLGKNLDFNAEFVHAQDSYDKHFSVDFGGNTKSSECYLKGPLNRAGCDHYSKNVYKKLFVVDRTLAGEQFWNNETIEERKNCANNEIGSEVVEKPDIKKPEITILDFRKQHFESPAQKFFNTQLLNEEICLSKYKKKLDNHALYSTIRVFKRMIDFESATTFLTNLSLHFAENNEMDDPEKSIKGIIEKNYEFIKAENLRTIEKQKSNDIPEETEKICKCSKKKKSFSDKISCWKSECEKFRKIIRAKKIPMYFESQFCEVIE